MNELKHCRLAAMDLDGSLLNDNKQLCDGAAATLAEAAARGVCLVPITGRPYTGIPNCVRSLPFIQYIICSNGAQIMDAKTGKALNSFTIDNTRSKKIMASLRALGCVFEPFANGVGYTEPAVFENYMKQFKGTPLEEYITSSRHMVDCVESVFDDGVTVADEFFVNCPDEQTRAQMTAAMATLGGLQICLLGDRFAEVTNQGCDKGEALAVLCRRLSVPIAQTVAFGDGENDLLLLEKAGVAVAMGNAHPSVKKRADIVTDSNNDNGVCKIIKKVML